MCVCVVQTEKGLRKEDSEKVQSLEVALQESQAELKAEKLLLHEVCLLPQTTCLSVGLLASMPVACCCTRMCVCVCVCAARLPAMRLLVLVTKFCFPVSCLLTCMLLALCVCAADLSVLVQL